MPPLMPVIVILNDDFHLLQFLEERVKEYSPRVSVACFPSNGEAERFVMDNKDRIVGYIQDLNRVGDGGPGAGIRFYDGVIKRLTPTARTVVFSVSIDFHPDFRARIEVDDHDKVRICDLTRGSTHDLGSQLIWLVPPVLPDADSPLSEFDRALVGLIAPPWKKLCRYLAMNPDYLHKLDPRQFEFLVGEIFLSNGWEVDFTVRTKDGGYDVIAIRRQIPTDFRVLVEAKRYAPNRAVGVNIIRSLYGLNACRAVSQLVLATTSYVSRDAKKEFNRVVPWELDFLERDKILQWCERYGAVHHE